MSSDNDDFMMDMDDEEDYGFEYEEEEEEEEENNTNVDSANQKSSKSSDLNILLENQYYNAKARKEENDFTGAVRDFQEIVSTSGQIDAPERSKEWRFKALKQLIKIHAKQKLSEKIIPYYEQLLSSFSSSHQQVITKNYFEKSVQNLLEFVSNSVSLNFDFLNLFYQKTITALESSSTQHQRLLTKTLLKQGKLWLDCGDFAKLNRVLKRLKSYSADDLNLLEVYALEIQMYSETKNQKKLFELYQQCLSVKSAIPHPRILGIVRECGGKMRMHEKEWSLAQQDFFEAFKSYDEAGSPQRIQCLKYFVLANMLSQSEINPFDSQETKPYKNDPEIVAMTNLVAAYQRNDVHEFEKVLRNNQSTIMDDPFIKMYIDSVLNNIRTQVLLQLVSPYRSISLAHLANQLKISVEEVENLLVLLILDDKLNARLDQIEMKLLLQKSSDLEESQRYSQLNKWAASLEQLENIIISNTVS